MVDGERDEAEYLRCLAFAYGQLSWERRYVHHSSIHRYFFRILADRPATLSVLASPLL